MKRLNWIKKINLRIIFILIVALCLVGSISYQPQVSKIIVLELGTTSRQIAQKLKQEKIIPNVTIFLIYTKLTREGNKLQAGRYELNNKMGMSVILDKLTKGDVWGIKITVPEGYTSIQIADLLASKKLANKNRFLRLVKEKNLEGYLFPATYIIPPGTETEAIAQIMVEKFNNVFKEEFGQRLKELNYSQKQIITLASIIEREAKKNQERQLISAVFHNRLKKGYLLESCATVEYALRKNKVHLTYEDLKIKSPYNTYLYPGLPPGPICNPGEASIRAALYPVKSEALFFVAQGDGTHRFSKYYQEHLQQKTIIKNKKKG